MTLAENPAWFPALEAALNGPRTGEAFWYALVVLRGSWALGLLFMLLSLRRLPRSSSKTVAAFGLITGLSLYAMEFSFLFALAGHRQSVAVSGLIALVAANAITYGSAALLWRIEARCRRLTKARNSAPQR